MNPVMIRNLEIGTGQPKVIVPIVAVSAGDIIARAESFRSIPLDVVEWRVDFYEDVFQTEKVLETLSKLRAALGDTPL